MLAPRSVAGGTGTGALLCLRSRVTGVAAPETAPVPPTAERPPPPHVRGAGYVLVLPLISNSLHPWAQPVAMPVRRISSAWHPRHPGGGRGCGRGTGARPPLVRGWRGRYGTRQVVVP